ncbi:MAG: Rrf2 family transcriptional regulator [Bdellovibrionota bacterium]
MVDQRFSTSVHIMTALAFGKCQDGQLMTSDELAESVRTNPTVVRRLVAKLVEAKLLKAYKGKMGGVELARCPDEITLKDIYVAASGKALIQSRTSAPKKHCPVSCAMGNLMSDVIEGVERNSMKYLASISLASLTSKVATK